MVEIKRGLQKMLKPLREMKDKLVASRFDRRDKGRKEILVKELVTMLRGPNWRVKARRSRIM